MSKSIAEITKIIVDFSDERDWKNNDPNQLISSILIELGELTEYYQWKNKFPEFSEEQKLELGFKFVDVIFYLFRLANKSGIDIEKYFDLKLPRLAEKFPIGKNAIEAREEYRKAGKNKRYE